MKISHDIREEAARTAGLEQMSATFNRQGGKVYVALAGAPVAE